jgi:hypothetical protein
MLCVSSPALDMIAQYFRYWSPLCSFSLEYLGFSLNHFVLWYFGVCSFDFPTEIVHGYALLGDKLLWVVRFPSVSDESHLPYWFDLNIPPIFHISIIAWILSLALLLSSGEGALH